MIAQWVQLSGPERDSCRAAVAFLAGRLEERSTIDWALRLDSRRLAERLAVLDLLGAPAGRQIHEPWRSAWRLIEESWQNPIDRRADSIGAYAIRERIKQGDRSGTAISQIASLVRPVIEVKSFSDWDLSARKLPRQPRSVNHLMSVHLTSGEVIDPAKIGLDVVQDRRFLVELARELDAAVFKGLDIGRRLGWDDEHSFWRLGMLYRVYFVPAIEVPGDEHEPDEFHRGIAPAVKLLHAVVSQLIEVDVEDAQSFGKGWQAAGTPVHVRLWAALARDSRIVSGTEIGAFLVDCDNRRFWKVQEYPEIAELRARRFADLNQADQRAILARLRKGAPWSHWPKDVERERVEEARTYWTTRELRRIEIAGAQLPPRQREWLAAQLERFDDLREMSRLDEGFPGIRKASWVPPNPDDRYDLLEGTKRLDALEAALAGGRRNWDDDPAARASDWMRQPARTTAVLDDLAAAPNVGEAYPRVWEQFGWTHSPPPEGSNVDQHGAAQEQKRVAKLVLGLLERLPEKTVRQAIEGIAAWLSAWQRQIAAAPDLARVWTRLWPISVEVTNAPQREDADPDLNVVVTTADDREPEDLDTLNTPAGKLVGVFLAACPSARMGDRPFEENLSLRAMRDTGIAAPGRSGLIARHRIIEALPWFLVADPEWTRDRLLAPLLADTNESLALWRAVARQTHFTEVLRIIGEPMAERATDPRLGRETRRSLAWSVVLESLHAFREERDPVVPHARVQQMLRSLDDEVRANAAEAVQRFVRDLSEKPKGTTNPPTAESLFRNAARPFLHQVWPQERSLTTPGIARAFADLPAACGEAFAEAVDVIERFLVPFECWSMVDYGLYGEEEGEPRLSQIDSTAKAEALLRLLDRTIGTPEGAIVPMDLGSALDQVQTVAPHLAETPRFRRLATLTRR